MTEHLLGLRNALKVPILLHLLLIFIAILWCLYVNCYYLYFYPWRNYDFSAVGSELRYEHIWPNSSTKIYDHFAMWMNLYICLYVCVFNYTNEMAELKTHMWWFYRFSFLFFFFTPSLGLKSIYLILKILQCSFVVMVQNMRN